MNIYEKKVEEYRKDRDRRNNYILFLTIMGFIFLFIGVFDYSGGDFRYDESIPLNYWYFVPGILIVIGVFILLFRKESISIPAQGGTFLLPKKNELQKINYSFSGIKVKAIEFVFERGSISFLPPLHFEEPESGKLRVSGKLIFDPTSISREVDENSFFVIKEKHHYSILRESYKTIMPNFYCK